MKLFIVRHGDTEHIQKQLVMGWTGSELTADGKNQANKLADQLADKKIDLIISSDLNRTRQTAEILSEKLGAPLIFDWLLRERRNGSLENKSNVELDWERYNIENDKNKKLGIEPISNIVKRAQAFLNGLKFLPVSAKNIVVISHSGFINSLLFELDNQHRYRKIGHMEIIAKEAK